MKKTCTISKMSITDLDEHQQEHSRKLHSQVQQAIEIMCNVSVHDKILLRLKAGALYRAIETEAT